MNFSIKDLFDIVSGIKNFNESQLILLFLVIALFIAISVWGLMSGGLIFLIGIAAKIIYDAFINYMNEKKRISYEGLHNELTKLYVDIQAIKNKQENVYSLSRGSHIDHSRSIENGRVRIKEELEALFEKAKKVLLKKDLIEFLEIPTIIIRYIEKIM